MWYRVGLLSIDYGNQYKNYSPDLNYMYVIRIVIGQNVDILGCPARFSHTWEYIWLHYKFIDDIRATSETGRIELWPQSAQFYPANLDKLYILIE